MTLLARLLAARLKNSKIDWHAIPKVQLNGLILMR